MGEKELKKAHTSGMSPEEALAYLKERRDAVRRLIEKGLLSE